MNVEILKDGLIRVSPIKEESKSVIVLTDKQPEVFHKGVVQSIGIMTPQECGFIEGDTIYYTDPLKFIKGSELVSIENVVLVCLK